MALTLDSRELALFQKALATLASPLEGVDLDGWRAEVNRSVRTLLEADQAVFFLPGCDAPRSMFSLQYGEDMAGPYLAYYRDIDEGWRRVMRDRLDVFSRRQLFAGDLPALLGSECYNDFLTRHGMGDSLGMVVRPGDPTSPGLWLHNRRFGRPNAGERGTRMLQLLFPAFTAGVAMWQRFHLQRRRLGVLLDELPEAAAVVDLAGRILHLNAGWRELQATAPAPVSRVLDLRVGAAARAARSVRGREGEPAAQDLHQRFTAGGRVWELHGALLGRPLGLEREAVLVTVRVGSPWSDERWLRRRFGLTSREAEVARLLAARKTNDEVAEALSVSPHTARHHTQSVLDKLGVRSRRNVAAALARGDGGNPGERRPGEGE